jgi:hypothetical protein
MLDFDIFSSRSLGPFAADRSRAFLDPCFATGNGSGQIAADKILRASV